MKTTRTSPISLPSGIEVKGTSPSHDDKRLRVLWFEDKLDFKFPDSLDHLVSIVRAYSPLAARQLLDVEDTLYETPKAGLSETPLLCPFDIYVADHDLKGAPRSKIKHSASASAAAAGVTASILMATNFPRHPATIVPYTAFDEQLVGQRDLLEQLCPKYLNVNWGSERSNKDREPRILLEYAIASHRDHLHAAARQGFVHLSVPEEARLRKILAPGYSEKSIRTRGTITFHTEAGPRQINLLSLWPEFAASPIDPARILCWLDGFPRTSAVVADAANCAYTYFSLRLSEPSQDRYELSSLIRKGITAGDEDVFLSLCHRFELDPSVARDESDRERENDKASVSARWTCPHLLSNKRFDPATLRLSIVFLLVYEEVLRWSTEESLTELLMREHSQEETAATVRRVRELFLRCPVHEPASEPIRRFVKRLRDELSIRRESESVVTKAYKASVAAIKKTRGCSLEEAIVSHKGMASDYKYLVGLIGQVPLSRLANLIDPLPEQILCADVAFAEGRIGKALSRPPISLNALAILRGHPEDTLSPSEMEEAVRFALDLEFPREGWPGWLESAYEGSRRR